MLTCRYRERINRQHKVQILFIISTLLLILTCIAMALIRDKWQSCEKVSFHSPADDSRPIPIKGLLLRPRDAGSWKLPGVIFCHGLMTNKEIYLGLCRRIANLGVAVLAIDLRGHGGSSGASEFSKSEHLDIRAALEFLSVRDDIDSERLAVVGHSLGGIVVTRACFMEGEMPSRAKAAVALFCWKSMRESVEAVFGPLETFVGRWWPFFGWSRQFSITDDAEMAERSVIEHLRPEVRVNYLLIAGSRDPLTDMERSAEIIAGAAGHPNIEPGVVHGNIKNETARKLVIVKGAHHLSVVSRRKSFEAIREWLQQCFELGSTETVPPISFSRLLKALRFATLVLFVISTAALLNPLSNLSSQLHMPSSKGTASAVLIGGGIALFLLCSGLAISFARMVRLKPFAPHWGADIISLVMASRTLLFGPLLVVLIVSCPGSNDPSLDLLGLAPVRLVSGVIVATVLFAWIVCSWNLVARVNLFPSFWPVVRVQTFFLLFGVFLVSYMAEETVFRGMIQTRLSGFQPVATVLLSALIYAVIASVAVVSALYTLFPFAAYAATFRSLSVPLIPVVFVFALIAFSVHGVVAAVLFHFTGSTVTPALFLALLISFLFSGPIGVRTY